MTYDVPVKLFSFHLVLMSLFLLAPNPARLRDFFVLQRATTVRGEEGLGATDRARRASVIAQIVYGGLVLALGAYGDHQGWAQFGGGAAKSPAYGSGRLIASRWTDAAVPRSSVTPHVGVAWCLSDPRELRSSG